MATPAQPFNLVHWRRTIAQIYACVREESTADPGTAWRNFRAARDDLFSFHSQSPLDAGQKAAFTGLSFYPYDPIWRVVGRIDHEVKRETFEIDLPNEGIFAYTRIARVLFAIDGEPAQLSLFWVEGYGGGLFLPFRDVTNRRRTYGNGRYLYDTVKGVDLGVGTDEMLLDFNFAYNPVSAYNQRRACPPVPEENKLPFAVTVGEMAFTA
ncbi:MAG: DUF1684 domain-containing protein [Ardenticatenaceae bacterium]|nr:DUF1684 domain-containing protein [Ardenticatenaceae bacterium]